MNTQMQQVMDIASRAEHKAYIETTKIYSNSDFKIDFFGIHGTKEAIAYYNKIYKETTEIVSKDYLI